MVKSIGQVAKWGRWAQGKAARRRLRGRRPERKLRLEMLEDRRLLAVELVAIATNQGALLRDGLVMNVAPRELQLRFNDGTRLDPVTLASGIEIIRSGGDGSFETASVRSDLNTGGQVVMQFRAVQPHSAGDGIQLVFSKNDRGPTGGVGIDVQGAIIKIDLNTAAGAATTAAALRSAINAHPQASQLIVADILRGNAFTNIAAPAINYSPLILGNANHARASTNFNQGNTVEVEFVAVQPGIPGNGIRINFVQSNFGGAGAPRISVVNRTITITLNTNPGNESTAAAVVAAVNADPAARQLVRATQIVGVPTARVTSGTAISGLVLGGANDVVIPAGFVGLGATENVAVFRFAESLPDDFYRINVLARPGGGRQPVADVNGTRFRNGEANASVGFELDLAPQVLSVVPQPISRDASGRLVQARNQIHVYFNDDDLDRASAENPNFYQLIATNDTVRNTDDLVFRPLAVQYDPVLDRAVLTFAANLEDLLGPGVATTFRLRIGTDEMLPLAPVVFDPGVDPGSSFDTALDLHGIFETGIVLVVRDDGRALRDGQTLRIASQSGVELTFEFDDTVVGPFGVAAGHVAVPFSDASTADDIAQALANAINNAVFGVTATLAGNRVFLAGDQRVLLDPTIRALGRATQGIIISGSIDNTGQPFPLNLPGAITEPGHRDIPVENHFIVPAPDAQDGITTEYYNFQTIYGFDPEGNPLQNAITEVQKRRVREVFELYSRYLGIQFIESATRGMTIAVGDMRAIDPNVPTGPGGVLGIADPLTRRLVMDLQDFDQQNDEYGGEFFQIAMHEIGHLLGLGHSTELAPITVMSGFAQPVTDRAEPIFPGDHDILHGRFLYRPESKDIDLYKFEVTQRGLFTAETIAERLPDDSHLDTLLTLWRETANGRELIAQNDNYFSRDSFLEVFLEPGTYYVGVSASGNRDYDPSLEDSGFGGRTEGAYQLRLHFRGDITNSIIDGDNSNNPTASPISAATALDGDGDGIPGGVFNYWFRVQTPARTLFVDKAAPSAGADGSLARPYNRISTALAAARPGDIVRIVGNGGADGDITTLSDNFAYEIGFSALGGQPLADGTTLEVPQGVTVMVDAGAVFKLRRARIGVGSSSQTLDRSAGAFQVLGVPRYADARGNVRLDEFGQPIVGSVLFTSLHEPIGVGTNPDPRPPAPAPGDWGGIVFRADLDHRDANRFSYEKQGIFLNQVYFADIRYGGGNVTINGVPTLIDPIHIADTRPTIAYSVITRSAHAAISANPNSFEESNFHSPEFQKSGTFSSDYFRRGPDIHGNRVLNNSINGLFVRVRTAPAAQPESLSVAARWDETDIVYVLQENLTIAGTPGGPILEGVAPPITLVKVTPGTAPGGTLAPGDYNYRITFVDASGNEGPASDVTQTVTIAGNPDVTGSPNIGTIILDNLPTVTQFPGFVTRRIYRSTAGGSGPYTLVAEINATARTFVDDGTTRGGELREVAEVVRGRLDGQLRVDPGVTVKSEGALLTLDMGSQLIAEGADGLPIVWTALADRRYGAGGTFNTGGNTSGNAAGPQPGSWAGIYAAPTSKLSIDRAVLAYAGGTARLEGAFRSFNTIEIHQADARVANSVLEFNADGFQPVDNDPQSIESRFGRGFNRPASIFVRGAQPVLLNNILRHNLGPAISINVNSLNADLVNDWGRSTGLAEVYPFSLGNRGPLVAGNRLDDNAINGMVVRAATLTTESVWDDTDIVHVIFDSIDVPDLHTLGGLRLVSKSTESLVIKARGPNAGFTAGGQPLDIDDRIGGAIQVLGHPRHPVVITSLEDCSVGAGFTPDGRPQTDTHNSGLCGAETSIPYADIVVVMDESGSMAFAQQFSVGFVAALDAGLAAAGIGDGTRGINRFGLVGFGDFNVVPRAIPVGAGGALFGTSSEYAVAAGQLTETGAIEDGWLALHFTVDTYLPLMRPEAAKFAILVTNEDRDQVDPTATFANTLAKLQSAGIKLEGILSVQIVDANNNTALALDAAGNSYTEDGTGGFIKAPGGRFLPGFDTTIPDYANMVHALGGIVGDIDQIQVGGLTAVSFANALVSSIVQQVGGVAAQPGDWRSIRFEEYSHDRNVDRLVETESIDGTLPDANNTPDRSEFLGDLAPHEKAGDETLRLGFVVDGVINNPRDVDVYRFTAEAGTEVWLDIDRTSQALDSVVELITAEGVVLARSVNSLAEASSPSLLFRDPSLPPQTVNPLQKSAFDGVDRYSTNPRDAGMRVVLPGVAGTRGTYYVRVRSNSNDLDRLDGGLTRGVYQLQVRLRELDEFPGSVVRGADIRFATTGIEVFGQPIHSPLTGEITEDSTPNNTIVNAQRMGNLMQTDRAALSIGGTLGAGGDVDFYQFDARYVQVQQSSGPQWVYATFDVDYADGLGRPDTLLSVFDANGNLVLVGRKSNIAEDQPGPLAGANMDDLSRGSAGKRDPFIGTVALPVGTYSAAVSPITQVPAELDQFFRPNPTNPLLRLEPVNSVRRIAEEHVESSGGGTADPPVFPVLLDQSSIVPWTLSDITLYVSQDPGTPDQTNLYTVDPFTGRLETTVGRFNFDVGDIAFRPRGDLVSYSLDLEVPPPSDANAGIYFRIDTGTAATTVIGSSGIETYEDDPASPGSPVRSNPVGGTRIGHGINFHAIAIGNIGDGVERGFAVGGRPPGVFPLGISVTQNILYEFDPNTGAALSAPASNRSGAQLLQGPGTQIVERGILDTAADPFGRRNTVIIAPEATTTDIFGNTIPIILDGTRFTIVQGPITRFFEFVSGPEILLTLDPTGSNPAFLRDGDTFFLDGVPFEIDTGEVFVMDAISGSSIRDGERFTVSSLVGTNTVTRIFEWDDGSGPPIGPNIVPVPFNTGMTQSQLIQAMVTAINSQTQPGVFEASAQRLGATNRISLLNSNAATENSAAMHIEGNTGRSTSRSIPNPPGTVLIPLEEVSTNADFGQSLVRVFNGTPGVPGIRVGWEGSRVNFLGPSSGDFRELTARRAVTDLGHDNLPNNPAATAIGFLADDTADQIAARMQTAIAGAGFTVSRNGAVLTLSGGARFDPARTDVPPFRLAGAAPGGLITGMAFVGDTLYAVSDRGGLYRVIDPHSAGGAALDYVDTAFDLLGINFQALAAGPRNLGGGAFQNILFGIDGNGRLYAFDTSGRLQPVFANGRTFIDTGIFDANGLAFSTLDTNLWHITDRRSNDPGHGINAAFDGSRQAQNGGSSFWFGWESQAANNVIIDPFYDPVNSVNTYDFPGGAHGSIISRPFSLEGYSAFDAPVLYFNYRLQTENASAIRGTGTPQFMRDAFRVFVGTEDGQWHLVGTNNSGRGSGLFDDEYDGAITPVQELYDIGENGAPASWRQARVDLSPFAGQKNLRLRFDFSTAGSMDVGNNATGGMTLHAVPGTDLRDGQLLLIDSDQFEIDLGATLVVPTGAAARDGETFTIHGQRFEFDNDGAVSGSNIPIRFDATQSAAALAAEIERILAATDYTLSANLRAETAGNEVIATAVDTGLQGGADVFRSQGRIGDNPNFTVNPGLDVDMARLRLNAGDTIQVTVLAEALGSPLDPVLRLFDSAGVQLAFSDNAPGLGRDSRIIFTAPRTDTYFVGISGAPNTAYSPIVQGFGTVGSTGDYELEIIVNGFSGVTPRLHGNRIQLDGAVKVSQSPGALVIDGAAGVAPNSLPLRVHADMTAAEVAAVLQQALADRYANGVLAAMPLDDNRITVITQSVLAPGPFGLTSQLPGDVFGAFYASKRFDGGTDAFNPGALRAQNNRFEGVFIDDIIIGFAERGEMATGSTGNSAYVTDPTAPTTAITVGAYQLEIRRSAEYGVVNPFAPPDLLLLRSIDTNDRLSQEHSLLAPIAYQLVDGQTFTLSDGVNSVVFEFEDVRVGNGVAPGHFAIAFDPQAFDSAGGRSAETAIVLAQRIRDAINSLAVQNVLQLRAALSDGTVNGTASTDTRVDLFGNAIIGSLSGSNIAGDLSAATEINDTKGQAVAGGLAPGTTGTYRATGFIGDNPTLLGLNAPLDVDLLRFDFAAGTVLTIDIDAALNGSTLDSVIRLFDSAGNELAFSDDAPAPGEPFTLDSYLRFVIPVTGTYYIGVSAFPNFTYDIDRAASGTAGFSTGSYTIEITALSGGIGFSRFDDFGDRNLFRDQGQLILSSNRITRSQQFGINVDGGRRDGPEGNPHQGPPRVTREINSQRLVPGVVIQNNILDSNLAGGIRFSGTPTAPGQQPGAVPFGRIVNNTIYGRRTADVGILVENNASPTILNNIVANLETGLSIDASSASTIVGGMLYQNNVVNSSTGALGSFPIVLQNGEPLFVEPTVGNFYLRAGSAAIDSSIQSMADRPALLSVKAPLGIAPSPILAPQRDILGQLRGDDPTVGTPPGLGENVFVDRGAVDRVDFAGPIGFVLDPRDNDAAGLDMDRRPNRVKLAAISRESFSIQLIDGVEPGDPNNGSGIDDRSVNPQQLLLFRDGQRLTEGVDYRFRYDAFNDVIRLTPIPGIWETGHTYVIRLANKDQFILTAPPGDQVNDGGQFTITDQTGNTVTFEFESGYTMTVAPTLALVMPAAGGGLGGMTDRQTMRISNGTATVTFEFDNNGNVAAGNTPIVFAPEFSAEQLADAVVQALRNANLNLAPVHLGRGVIHLGVLPNHTVDISNAPSLTLTGSLNGGVRDGDFVVLDDGRRVINFEFDLDGRVASGNTRVAFLQSDTHEQIADKFVAAIRANAVGLFPVHLGNGRIHLGGGPLTVLDTSASRITQVGLPGVRPEFGILIPSVGGVPVGIADGQTFQIGNGVGLPVTFEFDTNNVVVPGNTIIRIPATNPTLDQIANAMVQAIVSVGLGLTPVNAGAGRVILNDDTPAHFFNPLTSGLRQLGTPGVPGAVAVNYVPDATFTAAQMAQTIVQLINANTTLQGVSASSQDDQIFVDGARDVRGIVKVFVAGIRDIAGNVIQPNTLEGTTEFVIQLTEGFDFGDAPSSLGYPTLRSQNGARHRILSGFQLGAAIDVDVEGQATLAADGDDADGVDDEDGVSFGTLTRGYAATITVVAAGITAIQPGRLDAWIDWNRDGDWDDPGEQIARSLPLVNGSNVLSITVPVTAAPGTTYARFRLSSAGGLAPFGEAADGEVEDYQVTVVHSPWQNPVRREDVSGDGRVTPFDVLLLLRFLQRNGSVTLPVPPPFVTAGGQSIFPTNNMLDVNGDTRATTLDVVDVLRFLRTRGSGEGEAVANGASFPGSELPGVFSTTVVAAGATDGSPAVPLFQVQTKAHHRDDLSVESSAVARSSARSVTAKVREVEFRLAPASALHFASLEDQPGVLATDDNSWEDLLAEDVVQRRSHEELDAVFAEFAAE